MLSTNNKDNAGTANTMTCIIRKVRTHYILLPTLLFSLSRFDASFSLSPSFSFPSQTQPSPSQAVPRRRHHKQSRDSNSDNIK